MLPVIVSGFGERAVELAARIGDGYWGHAPDAEVIGQFEAAGGGGPRYAQLNVCWADDAAEARRTVHRVWPNGGIPGQLSQDLPTWRHFEEAAQIVTEDDAVGPTPCGPDVGPVLDSIDAYTSAGYDHVYFHQVGPDQEGFFRFWQDELSPAIDERFGRDGVDLREPERATRA
jgi:G6PDH family F420-dependent oxidoreductase